METVFVHKTAQGRGAKYHDSQVRSGRHHGIMRLMHLKGSAASAVPLDEDKIGEAAEGGQIQGLGSRQLPFGI